MKRFTENRILTWVMFLVIGALVTYLMTAAYRWGGLSYAMVAYLSPIAVTWFILPAARTHKLWRWIIVLFIATQVVYPFTAIASTVAIGWLLHQLYVVEFGAEKQPKISSSRPRTPKDHERKQQPKAGTKGKSTPKDGRRPSAPPRTGKGR